MRIFLWALAAILALNVVAAIGFAVWDLVAGHRQRAPLRFMGERTLGRIHPAGEPAPIRLGPTSVVAGGPRRRRPGRGPVSIALAVAVLCAGTAFASPGARRVVAGAFGAVVRGIRQEPDQRAVEVTVLAADGSPLPASGSATSHSPSPAADPLRSASGSADPADPSSAAAGTPRPASPATVTAVSGSSTDLRLTWGDVAGETGYRLERSTDGAAGWITVATTGPDVTSATDAGLAPGTTFYYRVFAWNAGGDSPASDVASATTTVDPASPTAVEASTVSSTQIDVTWGDVVDETGYRVERSLDGATGWITVATTGRDVTNATDAGLPSGTTFYYRVFASNAGGDSSASDIAVASTAGDPDPAPEDAAGG